MSINMGCDPPMVSRRPSTKHMIHHFTSVNSMSLVANLSLSFKSSARKTMMAVTPKLSSEGLPLRTSHFLMRSATFTNAARGGSPSPQPASMEDGGGTTAFRVARLALGARGSHF